MFRFLVVNRIVLLQVLKLDYARLVNLISFHYRQQCLVNVVIGAHKQTRFDAPFQYKTVFFLTPSGVGDTNFSSICDDRWSFKRVRGVQNSHYIIFSITELCRRGVGEWDKDKFGRPDDGVKWGGFVGCGGGVATLFYPICTNNRTPAAKYMTRDVLVSSERSLGS